jgi:enamine deaminase RidA (YjgF/YER057c/UK114 family)
MPRKLISTGSPFEKSGGYSRAVVDGDFCFVAGTTGYDYASMSMPADIETQVHNCFKTINSVLAQAGFVLEDVVRATYYVTDPADMGTVSTTCGQYFRDIRPAGTMVAVSRLFTPEMKVEIEVTAKKRT